MWWEMTKIRGLVIGLAAAGAVLLPAGPSAAQATGSAPATAGQMLKRAIGYFADTDYARSLALLQQATTRATGRRLQARIYLYIGLNNALLKRSKPAHDALRWAVTFDADVVAKASTGVAPALAQWVAKIHAERRGTVVVDVVGQAGPVVMVDGKIVGRAPQTVRLLPGPHVLVVTSPAGEAKRRKLFVRAGQTQRVALGFRQAVPKPAPPTPTPPKAPPRKRKSRRYTWTAVTLGLSAATLLAGSIVGLVFHTDLAKAKDIVDENDRSRADELEQLRESTLPKEARAANVLFIVSGGLVALTAVVFAIEASLPRRETARGSGGTRSAGLRLQVQPWIGRQAGLGIGGRF